MNIDSSKLRDHQVAPAHHLLDILTTSGHAADLSDTGTGKTYVAASVLAAMNRPTLVVVPKPAIFGWHAAAKYFGTSYDILNYDMLRTGRTMYGQWQHPPGERRSVAVCKNCQCIIGATSDPCYCRPDGMHELEYHKEPRRYGKFRWHPAIDTIVFDEVHRCGAMDSLQSEMLIAAKRDNKRVLCLSATAACSPLQMKALGYVLDLHTLTQESGFYGRGLSFYSWARRHGCQNTTWGGFQWLVSNEERQRQIMANISREIIPARGVRIRREDIPGFPTCSIHCKLYSIEEASRINGLYQQMEQQLRELDERKAKDIDPNNPLTILLRARQEVELLKVPVFDELARDYINKGHSVALFLNFTASIQVLSGRLKDIPHVIIDGSPEYCKVRDAAVAGFESDMFRLVLVNVAAGSEAIGLRDLRGVYSRVGLVSPTFSARAMRQLFGRLPRDGSKSHSTYYVVFAAGTVEEEICHTSGGKMDNYDALNDADLIPRNLLEARSSKRAASGR